MAWPPALAWLPGGLQITESRPQPGGLIAPAELPPLRALSLPDDPVVKLGSPDLALVHGQVEQSSLSFSG
jgi:hypothetical protein